MKIAIDLSQQSGGDQANEPRREWSGRIIVRLVLAALLLSFVYLLASWIPVERSDATGNMISSFLFFWVLGGIFTITVLALSDRQG